MSKIFEEIERKGQRISSIKAATMMIKLGKLTIEEIVLYSGLLLKEVQNLENKIKNKKEE